MIWAVASDAHRGTRCVQLLLDALPKVEALCFLGDCAADGEALEAGLRLRQPKAAFYAVAGNNDLHCAYPQEMIVRFGARRILLSHGHRFRVKQQLDMLSYRAREAEVDAVLYGHTHCQALEYAYDAALFNPGALCDGRYGLLFLDEQELVFRHLQLRP